LKEIEVEKLTKYRLEDSYELLELSTVKSDVIFDRGSEDFRRALSKQLIDSVWTFGKDSADRAEACIGALQAWEKFDSQDPIEALLVTQMIATHNAAMGWAQRATLEALPVETCERATNKAVQLMSIFQSQAATLAKHRGKGEQKIEIKRVTVVEAPGNSR
jgi:hypothetical protein